MTTITAQERARAAARRSWRVDGLEAAIWLACATGIALMVSSGGLLAESVTDWFYTVGRALGIVAAVLMMTQVLLASRAPWVERAIGHDRAIARHTRIGPVAIILLLIHLTMMTATTAAYDGRNFMEQNLAWSDYGWFMTWAQISAAVFLVVLVTSLAAVRLRWRYERWHAVHLLVYVGVAFAVPHQFLEGSTFRGGGLAWWFWALLWTVSIGSFVAYRIVRPLVLMRRYGLTVETVDQHDDGSTTVTLAGRDLHRMRASAGQFFLWRFLAPGMRWESHPYSLSSAPGDRLRITVKAAGDGSSQVRGVEPGTRVLAEGPLGVFTHATRTRSALLLVAAGIGVTPVRAMLEETGSDEDVTVVIRARSPEEAPLLTEIEELAAAREARLEVVFGPRGETWGSRDRAGSVGDFLRKPDDTDIYICGPREWAAQVAADALASGVPRDAIHREEFGW